ncbi:IPT/TIG domain-containing protein, partial [Kineococcus radiotolerans]
MNKRSKTRRRIGGVGAGVALLVGLGGVVGAPAQAATGFNPGAADARLGGADRYATAAVIAQKYWTSARTVIVANGETNGIDALSASYLAGVKNAPILLTTANSVPTATADAIRALNPSEVIVIGGEPSVSTQTFNALTAGRATNKRLAGVDRFDTAAKIVAEARAALPANAPAPAALLARGDVYGGAIAADALAASPLGYRGVPIVLTAQGSLPASSASVLQNLKPTSVTALGSTLSISAAAAAQAATAAGVSTTARLEGADRSATAAAIAGSPLAAAAGIGKTAVGIANGFRVDALVAGPAAGKAGYPLLLTESATSLGAATEAYLRANSGNLISAQVFGDATAVSPTVTDAAAVSGGGTPAPGTIAPVVNPVAAAPANLDNQGDQPDVRVSFGLGTASLTGFTVQRVSSNDPNVSSAVNLTGQDVSSGSFIDYDVPAGSWVYRITATGGGQTAVVVTQAPASTQAAPTLSGQPTGLVPGSSSVTLAFDQPVSGLIAGEITSTNSGLTFAPTPVAPTDGRSATWTLAVSGGTLALGDTISIAARAVVNAQGIAGPASLFTSGAVAAASSITSLSPAAGTTAGGTVVTITGTGFTGATGVTFGGVAGTAFTVVNDTTITVTTPAHAVGAVDVVVTDPAGNGTRTNGFTYGVPSAVTAVSPAVGAPAGGTAVMITGTGFTGATGVTFGGVAGSSFVVVSDTSITVTTPAHAEGAVNVVVTDPAGNGTRNSGFTYQAASAITGVSPATGAAAGGTAVTITGTGFTGATGVTFDGVAGSSFVVVSDTSITVTTPAHAEGAVNVVVADPAGDGTSNNGFAYQAAASAITGVSPATGAAAGGTPVTITGTGFTGATGVTFDGVAGSSFVVVSDTSITVT